MQNAFFENFNGRLRDEFLNETLFTCSPRLARHEPLSRKRRRDDNTVRPHSRIGWLTPAACMPNVLTATGPRALRSR